MIRCLGFRLTCLAILGAMLLGTTVQALLKPFRPRQLIHGVLALHLDPNLHPFGERKYLHVLPFPPPLPPLPFPALSPEASAAFNARLLGPPFLATCAPANVSNSANRCLWTP